MLAKARKVNNTLTRDTSTWLWPIIIIGSAISVGLLIFGDVFSPLRPPVAFWFLLICPGMAYVRLLGIRERLTEWSLALALSLAIDALVAGGMLYAGLWSPKLGLTILICLSIIGVALQIIMNYRSLLWSHQE